MRQPQLTALPGADPEPDRGVAAHGDVIGLAPRRLKDQLQPGAAGRRVASAMPF